MKKILLLIAFIIGSSVSAQDYNIIGQLKSTDFDNSLKLADNMKSMAKNNYHLFKYHEFEQEMILKIVYAPEGITDEQLKQSTDYSNCMVVEFKVFYEGRNLDLDKKGIKKYKLSKVSGKYLDVFPIWKSWFVPMADEEKTLTDSNSRELLDYDKNIQFYISKQGNTWTLRNDS